MPHFFLEHILCEPPKQLHHLKKKSKKDKGKKKKLSFAKESDLPEATFGMTTEASTPKKNTK